MTPPRPTPPRPVERAMVLCAGLGTRLRPLTLRYPKPALPFFGAPLIRYSLALLKAAGVRQVVINTHHLPEVMEAVARHEAEALGLELEVSPEPVIQGTAGALAAARRFLEGERFFLVNGDAFMSLDLKALAERHRASGAQATMAVVPMPEGESFAAVEATASGEVRRIAGVGAAQAGLVPWHFVGVHLIEPEVLEAIPPGERDINRAVYPELIARGGSVRAEPVTLGAWADLGSVPRYLKACGELLSGACDLSALGARAPLSPEQLAALRAADAAGQVLVAPGARIGVGALLERTVVDAEAEVGAGANLIDCAVLPDTRIAPGERPEGCLASGELRLR